MNPNRVLLTSHFVAGAGPEQSSFVRRNHVAQSWKGPVFAVEDVYVPCSRCHMPVDPVTRVPVGHSYFHPSCLRCTLCNCTSGTRVFREVKGQPVCHSCMMRGLDRTVKRLPLGASPLASSPVSPMRDARASTKGTLLLVERQESLSRHDPNLIVHSPAVCSTPSSGTPRKRAGTAASNKTPLLPKLSPPSVARLSAPPPDK